MKKLILAVSLSLFVASVYAGEGEGCPMHKNKAAGDKAKAECPAKKAEAEKQAEASKDAKPADTEKK